MHRHGKGLLGAPCTGFGVLPGPCPALLCFPLHQGTVLPSQAAGEVAGLVDTYTGDSMAQPLTVPPPLRPRGTRSLSLIAVPSCVPLAGRAARPPASPGPSAEREQRLLSALGSRRDLQTSR